MTKAVLFDLDDTLMPESPGYEKAFLAVCGIARDRHGLDTDLMQQSILRHAGALWRESQTLEFCNAMGIIAKEALWSNFGGDDRNLRILADFVPAFRTEAWSRALADQDVLDLLLAQELADVFPQERAKYNEPYAEAPSLLSDLQKEYKLGLITNGPGDIQRIKITSGGLADYFEAIVISGEIGAGKPDVKPFQTALQKLGVDAAEAVMVGNSLARDILGARNADIRSVLINRSDNENVDVEPDEEISNLDELRDLL